MLSPDENLRQFLGLPNEAEKAATSEAFQEKLSDIFIAGLPDTSTQDLLRAVVECENWFVPITPSGDFAAIEAKRGKYRAAIDPEKEQSAKYKIGRGGRLLPIHDREPDAPSIRLDGRSLARALSDDFNGLLIHRNEASPRELSGEHFADLKSVADACDFEDVFAMPASGQHEFLLQANWLVPMARDELILNDSMGKGNLLYVFTHLDRVSYDLSDRVVALHGEELCRLVLENEKVDGVAINRFKAIGRGKDSIREPAYAPAFFYRLLEGEDIRAGVRPFAVRSRQEVELWLQLRGFPFEQGEIIEEAQRGRTRLKAHTVRYLTKWRMQETVASQEDVLPPVCSPQFTIQILLDDEPSHILCPGLLARELNAGARDGRDAARYWRAGKNLLVGRYVDERWQMLSRSRLWRARELARFLPQGKNCIPRAAILTVEGAAFLRTHPHGGSRAWIEETIRQAERFTRSWVWPG